MLVAFSLVPSIEAGQSLPEVLAPMVEVVCESGLPHRTDAVFTTIEGSWQECIAVVERCIDVVQGASPRVVLTMQADVTPGHVSGELDGTLDRLAAAVSYL